MNATLDELKSTASNLSVSERAELVHYLLRTLEPTDDGANVEWLALANRRIERSAIRASRRYPR